MADKPKREREVMLGHIVVGEFGETDNGTRAFFPSDVQPPEGSDQDFRAVERWLVSEGIVGDHTLVRAYNKRVSVKERKTHTGTLID